jgi:hypothetical protein
MWHLFGIGLVERFAKFTPVNLGSLPDLRFHFLRVVIPAFQVSRAEFSLGILLVTGSLPWFANFYFYFFFFGLSRRRRGSCNRRYLGRRSRCRTLRCRFLSHSSVPLSIQRYFRILLESFAPHQAACASKSCQSENLTVPGIPPPQGTVPVEASLGPTSTDRAFRRCTVCLPA